jgi:hypothetical protein
MKDHLAGVGKSGLGQSVENLPTNGVVIHSPSFVTTRHYSPWKAVNNSWSMYVD